MSLARTLAAVVVAAAIALVVLAWRSRDAAEPARRAEPERRAEPARFAEPAPPAEKPAVASAIAPAPTTAPALPDDAPFREQDFAVTTDMPEGPLVALRSSMRSGRELAVELVTREPTPEGKRLFATVSVSDRLGNTIMDCTWRDIELSDDARKLECELPVDVELPLAISGHQRPAPSFVETPEVVAIDKGIHP